jgi:Ca-activated chloride channel family protein
MSFGNPWYLLALLLPLFGVFALRRHVGRGTGRRWPAMSRVAITGDRLRPLRRAAARPAPLVLAAVALGLVALSQPRWGEHSEDLYIHTRQVMIALDLSRSMGAEDAGGAGLSGDVPPSRLERARYLTGQLLDALRGESVGLIIFAGTAFVQVPLSTDYQIVREFLPVLTPDYMPQGGSDYKGMMEAALEGFGEQADSDRYLFVLSDGESSTADWETRLADLEERQVHVVALGLGSDKGAFIPDGFGGYLQDQDGGTIHSRLMPATLQALAKRTNGQYLDASSLRGPEDVQTLIRRTVETGQKGRQNAEVNLVEHERFQWFLLPAILLALIGLWREFQQRPRPREIRQRHSHALAAGLLLVALVGAAPPVRAHFDSEAEFDVREVFTTNPTERLRAITRHLGEFGYDAYDMRLMVEATIRYGVDQQREKLPVSVGAIHDAIDASHQGERLNASIASWPYYRAQLTAMLQQIEDSSLAEEDTGSRKELLDEEDNPPMVTGEGNQSFASDSFGQGTATRTDATLGEMPEDLDAPRPRRRDKPPLPKNVRAMAARNNAGGGGPDDAVLKLQQQRLAEIGKNDSPGRVHQLLAEMTGTRSNPQNNFDW